MQQKHNDGVHIAQIITRTECRQHGVDIEQPCWDVFLDTSEGPARAVCGSRIRAAGFVGQITETSIQAKRKMTKKEVRV